jgi:hypothetical protein
MQMGRMGDASGSLLSRSGAGLCRFCSAFVSGLFRFCIAFVSLSVQKNAGFFEEDVVSGPPSVTFVDFFCRLPPKVEPARPKKAGSRKHETDQNWAATVGPTVAKREAVFSVPPLFLFSALSRFRDFASSRSQHDDTTVTTDRIELFVSVVPLW